MTMAAMTRFRFLEEDGEEEAVVSTLITLPTSENPSTTSMVHVLRSPFSYFTYKLRQLVPRTTSVVHAASRPSAHRCPRAQG